MNRSILTKWNSVVHKGDLVIIVGDFAWKNHEKWVQKLNGKKILIRGNHDKMSQRALNQFTEVHWFLERKIGSNLVTFCHYPMKSWRASCHGTWHLYGHCHGRMPEGAHSMSFDVGMDVWDFYPIPWDVIKHKMMTKRRIPFTKSSESDKNFEILKFENTKLLKEYMDGRNDSKSI